MDDIFSTEQRYLHDDGIASISGDLGNILADPHQYESAGEIIPPKEKVNSKKKGNEDLEQRTTEKLDELTKKDEDEMPSFMNDQIDAVYEME